MKIKLGFRNGINVSKLGLTGLASGGAPVTIVQDTFTGANGTAITSHTPNVDRVGGGWQLTAGAAIILASNRAAGNASPAYPGNVGYLETNVSSCVVSATLRIVQTNLNDALVFRFVDSGNMWLAVLNHQTGQFLLRKREGASNSDVQSANVALSTGVDYTVVATLNGDSITVTLNGANPLSTTSTFNNTATKHGIALRQSNEIGDDFLVHTDF